MQFELRYVRGVDRILTENSLIQIEALLANIASSSKSEEMPWSIWGCNATRNESKNKIHTQILRCWRGEEQSKIWLRSLIFKIYRWISKQVLLFSHQNMIKSAEGAAVFLEQRRLVCWFSRKSAMDVCWSLLTHSPVVSPDIFLIKLIIHAFAHSHQFVVASHVFVPPFIINRGCHILYV